MLRFRIRRGKTDVKLEYMITRRGQSRDHDAELQGADENPSVVSASMNRLIEPDALIPTDGKIKELAVRSDWLAERHGDKSQGRLRLLLHEYALEGERRYIVFLLKWPWHSEATLYLPRKWVLTFLSSTKSSASYRYSRPFCWLPMIPNAVADRIH